MINNSISNTKFSSRIKALKRYSNIKWRRNVYFEPNLRNSSSLESTFDCGKGDYIKKIDQIPSDIEEEIDPCLKTLTIGSARGSICVSQSRYGIIGKIARALGYRLVKENKLWNILWTDSLPGVELYKTMKRFQQINHFPGMMEICRKDLLSRNLNRMLKLFPKDYKIFPKTWIFPADYGDAVNFASKRNKLRTFILKPDSGAQGRGIWLTNDLKTINTSERMICQTYINKPLLIDGYKFDLRVYTLITSVNPLRIFVYNEGLARFATNKYVEPTSNNACDLFMHLTNYSVNKRSSQYELCDNDDCGSKRTFSAINSWLRLRNHDVQEFWSNIDDIIIKTVLSALPMLKHNYQACFPAHDKIQACFEILGFDILLDSKMKPYILEVNHSPSFHTNEPVDRQVKRALISDTLKLVGTVLVDKRQILREDRKRVKQRLLNVHRQNEINSSLTLRSVEANALTKSKKEKHRLNRGHEELVGVDTDSDGSSPLAQQIAWEESHLGDFRRIMPPLDEEKMNYYNQFYALENQASIFCDTAVSKKREQDAKMLRLQLEEKRKQQVALNLGQKRQKFEDRRKHRQGMTRAVIEKARLQLFRTRANWVPGFISTAEDRLRQSWMQCRTDILKNTKIVEILFSQMYYAGVLSNSDIQFYPSLYKQLEMGYEIVTNSL